jgi:hypothetical protein
MSAQVDTRVQFYKWFNELTDRGLIPRCPGYERGAKLPPPDQVQYPSPCCSVPWPWGRHRQMKLVHLS